MFSHVLALHQPLTTSKDHLVYQALRSGLQVWPEAKRNPHRGPMPYMDHSGALLGVTAGPTAPKDERTPCLLEYQVRVPLLVHVWSIGSTLW